MSLEGWGSINFNWKNDGNSKMNFYGCNTAFEELDRKSFAGRLSNESNMANVSVSGQSSFAYPSFRPHIRSTSIARSNNFPRLGFSFRETYLVGGNKGQGKNALGFSKPRFPRANHMNTYKNGKKIETGYGPNY